jgi:hypothetical protein
MTMDIFNPPDAGLLAALLLGPVCAFLNRVMVLAVLVLVLRGSKPSERPDLLRSVTECLGCLTPGSSRIRHQNRSLPYTQ